jgi:hypothetical protein
VAATAAVSNQPGNDNNADDAQQGEAQAPRQYNGAMFRAPRGPIAPRQQRPQRRQPPQQNAAQAANDEAMAAGSVQRQRGVALPVELSAGSGSQREAQDEQRHVGAAARKLNEQPGTKTVESRFRVPSKALSSATHETSALDAVRSSLSAASGKQHGQPLQHLAHALLNTAKQLADAPQQMRRALLAQVSEAIGAAGPSAAATDLKKARAELIEAARSLSRADHGSAAQSDVLSLLPLVLLSVEQQRSPQQTQRALAKLEVMQRNAT